MEFGVAPYIMHRMLSATKPANQSVVLRLPYFYSVVDVIRISNCTACCLAILLQTLIDSTLAPATFPAHDAMIRANGQLANARSAAGLIIFITCL